MPDQTEKVANDVGEAAAGMVTNISSSLQGAVEQLWEKTLALIPNLAAMLVILVVGYFVACFLRWLARSVLKRLNVDALCDRIGLHDVTGSFGIETPASQLLAQLIFWVAMLMFLVAAVDALGMESVTQSINSIMAYIPNVVGAAVIVIFGVMLANFAKTMVQAAAERLDVDHASALGQLVYGVIVILIGSLAIGQLNLHTALVDRVIEIAIMAIGAALALALGFGTRDTARQVVAGVYARESFPVGTRVDVNGQRGTVESVRSVNTAIKTEGGDLLIIPNAQLMETNVVQLG